MARSKFNRKNSTGSAQPLQRKASSGAAAAAASAPTQGLIGSTSKKDTLEAIDYHFDHLNTNLKSFLLSDPNTLNLKRFVDFWSSPENIDSTSPNVAASICGCSWYLGMNYLSIGMLAEARALTLNGCFLQQCFNTPIEEITAICSESAASSFRTSLPFFNDGLVAISTQQRLAIFLKSKVTTDYQRRMAFATRTKKSKSQVQDYINQIGSDWNGTSGGSSKAKAFRRRASTGTNASDEVKTIEIILIDAHTKKETSMRHVSSMPLKNLIKKFADEQNLPLKKLRFSCKGKTLFLSTLGQKSPQDVGISNHDSIFVYNKDTSSDDEATASSSSDESSKENSSPAVVVTPCLKKFKAFNRKNSHTPCVYVVQEEQDRRNHSRKLSKIFEEAEPRFKEIRQKLALLNIECQPKSKSRPRIVPSVVKPIDNPCMTGQGGKAGVPFYVVHVGETDNLYKTRHAVVGKKSSSLSIDLHGYTRAEALDELDAKLPEWIDTAQRGQYPFVIPVTIICGGGNQILSETVDEWIKSNDNVANAPKKKFSRRASY